MNATQEERKKKKKKEKKKRTRVKGEVHILNYKQEKELT